MRRFSIAASVAAASFLLAGTASADRVALLSSRGGADARTSLDVDLAQGLKSLGHTLVSAEDLAAAVSAKVADGVADSKPEYMAVARATQADWVVVASIDASSSTPRVEITACLGATGRVEVVARGVQRANELAQTQEMLALLVRTGGIGPGPLPWESGAPTAPSDPSPGAPSAPTALEDPPDPRAHRWSFASYSDGKRGFVGLATGFDMPVVRPAVPATVTSKGAAFAADLRGGYALGDLGFEILGDLGGNLYGPRVLWLDAGVRWMVGPALRRGGDGALHGAPFFIGPELLGGAFFQLATTDGAYSASAVTRGMLGGSLDMALAVAPRVTLDAHLGNLRWVPGGGGALVFVGADVGASVHFSTESPQDDASVLVELPTRRATKELAQRLAAAIAPGNLLVLSGALGAGKTFLTRALCRALGVPFAEPITSPTFTLVHEHRARISVVHADLYRLRDGSELGELGLREARGDGAVVVVEWGEPFLADLGGDALVLELAVHARGRRAARARGTGPRGHELARACGSSLVRSVAAGSLPP